MFPPAMYGWVIKPLLFLLPAEAAHHFAFAALRFLRWVPFAARWLAARLSSRDPGLAVEALRCSFPTPIVLAAGFDKNAVACDPLASLGFGGIEVGTITGEPQPGNPKPRLFRLPADRALVNRMGFNNHGAEAVAARLAARAGRRDRSRIPIGVNIGKTKVVAETDAARDYVKSTEWLAPYADYLVVNVSSPNTPGLRNLQAVEVLRPLLETVRSAIDRRCNGASKKPALLVKIAPDLSDEDIDRIADLALELGLDGIIATNTTISRTGLRTPSDRVEAIGAGGLSGAPLKRRALAVLRRIARRTRGRVTLVAAGGVDSIDDAWERIRAGATLVQIYTSFVYEGPLLPRRLARGLLARAREAGYSRVQDAVGADEFADPPPAGAPILPRDDEA